MNDDPYVYAGISALRNLLGIRNANELDKVERQLMRERSLEAMPQGSFDLSHLKAIHPSFPGYLRMGGQDPQR